MSVISDRPSVYLSACSFSSTTESIWSKFTEKDFLSPTIKMRENMNGELLNTLSEYRDLNESVQTVKYVRQWINGSPSSYNTLCTIRATVHKTISMSSDIECGSDPQDFCTAPYKKAYPAAETSAIIRTNEAPVMNYSWRPRPNPSANFYRPENLPTGSSKSSNSLENRNHGKVIWKCFDLGHIDRDLETVTFIPSLLGF